MLGPRYQYILLSSSAFSDRVVAIGAEFTFTLEMEAELTCNPSLSAAFDQANAFSYILIRSDFPTLFIDIVYAIIEGANII